MWTRFHVKCNNCDKVTNLRIQIPEKEILPVVFKCSGCSSELKGTLKVDSIKGGFDFTVQRGILVRQEFDSGDYFFEFSDTLATAKPSTTPHNMVMPTMRIPQQDFHKLKITKDGRKLRSNEEWEDFKDLVRAYENSDKPIIEKLSIALLKRIFPPEKLSIKSELDYQRNYFLVLNNFIYPWIDFDNHAEFVEWLSKIFFDRKNLKNPDLQDFIYNVMTKDVCNRIKLEAGDLTIRFSDLREYFLYAYNEHKIAEEFVAIEGFNLLKNFYTDCFEFVGRTSHLIFRLQNFSERGNQDSIPDGCPKNVTTATEFVALDHGQKLDILTLSNQTEPKSVYTKSFNNKLRNGINHFKAKIDNETQVIYYYPITKKPDERFQIKYIDFLNLALDSFNSVLKIGQLVKFINFHKLIFKKENP